MTMTQTAPPAPYSSAPSPQQPPRSNRGLLIALIALAVAILIAVTVGITLLLTRTGDNQTASAASAAISPAAPAVDGTDQVGEVPADLKLRGPLTSPYTVCVIAKGVAPKLPTFPIPVVYDATTVQSAQAGRAQLAGLAAQVSPSAASPVGPALQRWIATRGAYLQAVIVHSSPEKLTSVDKADGQAAAGINSACSSVGVG